jgi:hypothetical protein
MDMPSSEPNKDMEDLLRAYAKKRGERGRQELPSELGTSARRILKDEVRRAFGNDRQQPAGIPAWRWLAARWPRLALGGCLAALLVLAVFRNVPPIVTRTPTPVIEPSGANRAKTLGQKFAQVNNDTRTQTGAMTPSKLLATFQMERQGQNVFVFDGDGSVYKGRVIGPAAMDKVARPKLENIYYGKAPQSDEVLDDTASYSFEVSGLNNDLKQTVVFTGDVLQMPQFVMRTVATKSGPPGAPVASLTSNQFTGGGGGGGGAQSAAYYPLSNQNQASAAQDQTSQFLRITGKVQVQGGGEFEIEAQPPPP